MKKILFIDNTAHHLYGQLHNIQAMHDQGYQISLLIPDDGRYFVKLQNLGFNCIADISSWKGQNPLAELILLLKLKQIIKQLAPDLVCSFTIKPNLYTAILLKNSEIKQIANITGLGYAFMSSQLKARLFVALYRFAFKRLSYAFFQNQDDYNFLTKLRIFPSLELLNVLPGSGIDLKKFSYVGLRESNSIKFLYSGRLLYDKGIGELIAAFELVKAKYPQSELIFIGNYFPANPSAISEVQVHEWVEAGLIHYLGMVDNVREVIANIDCMVLPSYREGMPRSLLEASSMGKPIITVDSTGCKDTVADGVTGYLAKTKDVDSLAAAMLKFIELPFSDKVQMGRNGRWKMEREFDQQQVIKKYLQTVEYLLNIEY